MSDKEKEKDKDISINLNCYTVRFRWKNERENYLSVRDAFWRKGFTDFVQEFVKTIDTKAFVNDTQNRILYLDRGLTLSSSMYSGIVRKGYSGQETYVDELNANKANTVGKIKTDQFNSTPFYFNITLPAPDSDCLLFVAQSYKQYGFKELFEEAFLKFFKEHYDNDILCEIGTLSIASLFEKYIRDGNIRKLRFKKHRLSQNLENILGEGDDTDKALYQMELAVSAKRKGFLGIKKNISLNGNSFVEFFKIDGFDYDEAFADVSIGGRKRVLNISNPNHFSASYDVTEKSVIDSVTKHPNFEKLDKEAIIIIREEIIPNIN